jgi:hypothetical protein
MPRQEWVGIEPMGEVFLLTFLFIGLFRKATIRPGANFLFADHPVVTGDVWSRLVAIIADWCCSKNIWANK